MCDTQSKRCDSEMFEIFKKKRILRYTACASEYLKCNYALDTPVETPKQEPTPPAQDNCIRYCFSDIDDDDSDVRYSARDSETPAYSLDDSYDSSVVTQLMQEYHLSTSSALLENLTRNTNKTFVDALIGYISKKGLRDSEVYKAAQIDRRLFSKIMSDREYKPSKDTAVALSLALELSLSEATDLLSRAGYTFSHSNKKDIIIEYFFREQFYKLDDINQVLFNLEQKIIGR